MWETINLCITFILASALLNIGTQGSYIHLNRRLVSNDGAKNNCITDSGRLLRYNKIIRDDSSVGIENLLDNGQSVWVDGYASFTQPVAFSGCFEYKKIYYYSPEKLDNNGLYFCARHCLNDQKYNHFTTEYIGVTDGGCYCLNKNDVNKKMRPVSESLCNKRCYQTYIDTCGGQGKVSVYRLYTDQSIKWANSGYFQGQCLFAKLKDNGTNMEVFRSSCYNNGRDVRVHGCSPVLQKNPLTRVSGFFCKTGEDSQLSRECTTRVSAKRYCVVNRSSTWEEARNVCLSYNGLLADLESVELLRPLMADNTGYWLGLYKPFIAAGIRYDLDTVCLAATKHDNRLFLEPDSCCKEKAYLCESSFMPSTTSKKDTSSSETIPTEGEDRESWKTTLVNAEVTNTSTLGTLSPNNLDTSTFTNELSPETSSPIEYSSSALTGVTPENAEITTTSSLDTSPNNLDTFIYTNEPTRETSNPTEHIYSTLSEANVTIGKYSITKENTTSATMNLQEPSGQSSSGINPFDANNFFAVAAVAFVAAVAVIAVGIVTWVIKRRCHKKSHKRCHKQTHSSTISPTISATPAVGNDEPEAYCITGEESVFRIAMDPNQNSFGGATADRAEFAAQGKALGTKNCAENHQYQNEGSLRLKQTPTYDRLKFKYLNIKYLYEDSSVHKDIHMYDHSFFNNAELKNKSIKDRAID